MILFLLPVVFSVLCSLLCCVPIEQLVFCLLAYLYLLLVTTLISPFYQFSNFYTYYGMIGCMNCVSLTTCADVLLDLIGACLFWYLYWFKIIIGIKFSLTIVCSNSFLFSVSLALTGFLCSNVSSIKGLQIFEPCRFLFSNIYK